MAENNPTRKFTLQQAKAIALGAPSVAALVVFAVTFMPQGPLIILAFGLVFTASLAGSVLEWIAMRHLKGVWLALAGVGFVALSGLALFSGLALAFIAYLSSVYP